MHKYHGQIFKSKKAFTIVELLVVIVVIGILAAITIVSYSGISSKATAASIQSDLSSNKNTLEMYRVDYGSYPTQLDGNNCAQAPNPDTKYCIKVSSGNSMTYSSLGNSYVLKESKSNISYHITNNSAVTLGCPTGFIVVPGSTTYGTNDFCVMKYEAKADDNSDGVGDTNRTTSYNTWPADTYPISASRKLVSSAAGYPVGNISQTIAITAASSFTNGCDVGCHLISEAEWMTIAQNVLSVPSNWSSGIVGSGYIYSGHGDNSPATALVADVSDANGYVNTGQSSGNQKRTLTLTNGEVIWDVAGNVWEWTAGQITGGLPNGMASLGYYEWTAVSAGTFAVNPYPSGVGISGSGSWNSTNGIGKIYGQTSDSNLRGLVRGGGWGSDTGSGMLTLDLGESPSLVISHVGLRITR